MTHFIRQQYLHVDLKGSESDGFAMQNRLTDLYYTKMVPAMEKILDQQSLSGSHLVIDKLEIDAGTIPLDRIDEDFVNAVSEALKQSLEKMAVKAGSRQKKKDQEVSFIRNEKENLWNVFTYFLLHGSLPWSFKLPAGISLEQLLSQEIISSGSEPAAILPASEILEVLKSYIAVNRLTMQFSDGFIRKLLTLVSHDLFQPVNELNTLLLKSDGTALNSEIRQFLKQLVLQKGILQIATYNKVSKVKITEQVLVELKTKPELESIVLEIFKPFLSEIETQKIDQGRIRITAEEEISVEKQTEEVIRRTAKNQDEETKQGIFIDNAGLVLLHPFLPRLFDELKFTRDEELLFPERALSLLHYLVTGDTESPEYELVLPKILCGIPVSQPVALPEGPSEPELSEASELLDAVINHWEVLRNTTRDGLRGNFLMRPGKLSQKDDGDWLLQVEHRAYDVLLDQLPWGISMIKLPWMKKMVWVEWR